MKHKLMNGNREVLLFDLDDMYIKVLDNQRLPYALKDYIMDSSSAVTREDFIRLNKHINCIRDFLSSRLLDPDRPGAKTILNAAALPQSHKMEERIRTAVACRGLCVTDNFWLQEEDEYTDYASVCLKTYHTSHKSYDIAILQRPMAATKEELYHDLTTGGVFPKFWRRENGRLELWKTDITKDNSNTRTEIQVSEMLDYSNIPHVPYRKETIDGRMFAVSECFVTDKEYFISAGDMAEYLEHTGSTATLSALFPRAFANMVCVDYIMANTDRNPGNYGFMVNAETNEITRFADLFDHNSARPDCSEIDKLVYAPTGLSFAETLERYAPYSNVLIDENRLPSGCRNRYLKYKSIRPLSNH